MKAEKIVRQKIRTPDFTPGIKRTETGMHLCVEAPGTFCRLAIYETGKKQGVRIPFSPEERVGDLWMMELAGDDFSGLEYTIETEQGELPDPAIPLPRPSRSVEAMRSAIPEAQAQLAAARTRLDTISGQLQATRDPSELTAQLAEKRRKLESLQSEYEAIQLAMDALSADWESAQDFLHVVIHHETLDAAQVTLTRCRTLCRLRQGDDLLPELAQLRQQLQQLDELERLSLRNIL